MCVCVKAAACYVAIHSAIPSHVLFVSILYLCCIGVGPFLLIDALMIEYSKPPAS